MKVVVSDTTAISSLLTIHRVDILRELFGRVIIPQAVASELAVAHPALPDFLETMSLHLSSVSFRKLEHLDDGEREAILLAQRIDANILIIDEKRGRRAAHSAGLQCVGLLGILLQAKSKGIIEDLGSILADLEFQSGFYLSDTLKRQILDSAGE